MNKPVTIVYEDFKKELALLINNAGLPAFIVESVLRDYLYDIRMVAQKQYQADKAEYEKSLENK